MTRTLIAVAVAGSVFVGVSGPLPAASGELQSCTCSHSAGAAKQAHRHRGWHDDLFARLGGLRSLVARIGGGQGAGGLQSMLGGIGGEGGIQEMLGGLGGAGGPQSRTGAGGRGGDAARQACMPDALRLCSDAIPDEARVKACMRAKSAQLSEACRVAMNDAGAAQPPPAGQNFAGDNGRRRFAAFGGRRNLDDVAAGQDYGGFAGGQGYDRFGVVRSLDGPGGGQGFDNFGDGRGGIDAGQLLGMARAMGFGWRGDWRD